MNEYDELCKKSAELEISEERYRLAVDGVNDGIWDWDNNKTFISNRCRAILGYEDDEIDNKWEDWISKIHPEDRDKFLGVVECYISEKPAKHFHMEFRIMSKNKTYKWVLVKGKAIFNKNGIPIRMAGSLTDINERKLAEEKIHQMAYYDSLTGLPNRTLFFDRFNIAVANALRKKRMVAIYFLDLDNFKTINDTLGHSYGDKLITEVGLRLKEQMRKGDTIARLGGDEFIIMQSNVKDPGEVVHMASRMIESFQKPSIMEGREFYISASIGISVYPDDGLDIQTLMKNADVAMYKAKEIGKNNFQLYTESLNKRMLEKLNMENDLRKAIERNELVIHYQPRIDMKTGQMVSLEALLRWNHSKLGLLYPGKFIHLAEETGLIVPIGYWVFRTACMQLKKWRDTSNDYIKMSINISARQFQQENLLETIELIIHETGVNPEWLEIEFNENIAIRELEYTVETLRKLKKLGLGIVLDDFGTGYSSIMFLKRLPINIIKIDESFIKDMTEKSSEMLIIKALIALAHSLNLKVTAEGVETLDKYELLMRMGCDLAQGYLFSSPIEEDKVKLPTLYKPFVFFQP